MEWDLIESGERRSPLSRQRDRCARQLGGVLRAVRRRLRPWRPTVTTDLGGRRGRRLRRQVSRATICYLADLGIGPPGHLLVVVQQRVIDRGRQLAALYELFEGGDGRDRQILYIALSVDARAVTDEEALGALRQHLRHVVATQLGLLRVSTPLEAAPATPPPGWSAGIDGVSRAARGIERTVGPVAAPRLPLDGARHRLPAGHGEVDVSAWGKER